MNTYSIFNTSNCEFNAVTNKHYVSMSLYIRGYKESTELLINSVVEGNSSPDSLIYPIMYSYRHYLELSFKNLFWVCTQITKKSDDFLIEKNHSLRFKKYNSIHNLENLWNETLILLKIIDKNLPEELTAQIQQTVDEFTKLDSFSTSFRYPENKNWDTSLGDQEYINVNSVAKNFVETSKLIEQLSCWVDSFERITYENPK